MARLRNLSSSNPTAEEYALFFGVILVACLLVRWIHHKFFEQPPPPRADHQTNIRITTPYQQPIQIRIDISNIPPINLPAAASPIPEETKKTV